jgi:hypothetical protein
LFERRLYFIVGDVLAASVIGGVAGALAAAMVSPAWNMWLAMFAGMILGMAVSTPLSFCFMPFFGAMEIMIPAMASGMFAGMWVAMAAAMRPVSPGLGLRGGMLIGIGVVIATYFINAWLRVRGDRRVA